MRWLLTYFVIGGYYIDYVMSSKESKGKQIISYFPTLGHFMQYKKHESEVRLGREIAGYKLLEQLRNSRIILAQASTIWQKNASSAPTVTGNSK